MLNHIQFMNAKLEKIKKFDKMREIQAPEEFVKYNHYNKKLYLLNYK